MGRGVVLVETFFSSVSPLPDRFERVFERKFRSRVKFWSLELLVGEYVGDSTSSHLLSYVYKVQRKYTKIQKVILFLQDPEDLFLKSTFLRVEIRDPRTISLRTRWPVVVGPGTILRLRVRVGSGRFSLGRRIVLGSTESACTLKPFRIQSSISRFGNHYNFLAYGWYFTNYPSVTRSWDSQVN